MNKLRELCDKHKQKLLDKTEARSKLDYTQAISRRIAKRCSSLEKLLSEWNNN